MASKIECKCIHPELRKVLEEAITNLEKDKVGSRHADYEKTMAEIDSHLESLRAMGIPEIQLDSMRRAIPKDSIIKQFDDLRQWLDECECKDDYGFDWQKFPYHDVGYKGEVAGTGKASRAYAFRSIEDQIKSGLCEMTGTSTDEALSDVYRIKALSEKSIEALEKNPDVREYMNKKYPSGWAQSNYKLELVKLGILSANEYDEWNRKITDVKKGCAKDLYNMWENQIYQLRKQLNLRINPKPEQLKKR